MIKTKEIREIFKKQNMKIGRVALKELERILIKEVQEISRHAIRQACLSGRKIVRKEDFA